MSRLLIAAAALIAIGLGVGAWFILGSDDDGEDASSAVLFFYNPEQDKDASGNVLCSAKGLVAVERDVPLLPANISTAIALLLEGELTAAERAAGITTEFPLPGVALRDSRLDGGRLTLTFADPENRTSGGSCRVAVLWAQIEATAKQFPGVTEVRFSPEELFQP